MPRSAVAPAAPAARSARTSSRERPLRVARLLAAVDHELLPHRQPRGSVPATGSGAPRRRPSRLQTRTRSSVMTGSPSSARSSGSAAGDALAGADRDDHQRHLRVARRRSARAGARRARCRRRRAARSRPRRRGGAVRRRRRCAPAVRPHARRARGRRSAWPPRRHRGQRGGSAMRARSSVMSPSPLSATTSSSSASMRARASTATETIGRSSDSVSSRSVCRWCLTPKPATPRSTRLVRSRWRA